MSTILVTGRNGFIGRSLVHALKDTHRIVSVVRRRNPSLDYGREELIISDIRYLTIDDVRKYPLEMVVHLAASLRGRGKSVEENNIAGSQKIFDLAEQLNIPVLFVSSFNSFFYKMLGSYAYSKSVGDGLLTRSRLRYLIVRVSLVMGQDLPVAQSVRQFYKKFRFLPLLGKGLGRTQPVPISLFVRFLKEAIEQNRFNRQSVNVLGQEAYTYRDILRNLLPDQNVCFFSVPLNLSLSVALALEMLPVQISLSAEEIKSMNMDKLFNGQEHGEVVFLDNRKEILLIK